MNAARDKDPKLFVQIRNTLTEQNRPYAVVLASKFARTNQHCNLQDLIQAACLGLTVAVERFDPTRAGYALEDFDPKKGGFTSYAAHFIKSEMREFARKERVVFKAISDNLKFEDKKIVWDFIREYGREPLEGEIEPPKGVSYARLMRAAAPHPTVLFQGRIPGTHEDSTEESCETALPEGLRTDETPESILLAKEENHDEMELLLCLRPDERQAVEEMVLKETPLRKVANLMGCSTKEVKDLVASGIAKMREHASCRP